MDHQTLPIQLDTSEQKPELKKQLQKELIVDLAVKYEMNPTDANRFDFLTEVRNYEQARY